MGDVTNESSTAWLTERLTNVRTHITLSDRRGQRKYGSICDAMATDQKYKSHKKFMILYSVSH